MWCYSNTCGNDGLIRLNKFVLRITDEFCNLFFLSIRIPHTTSLYNIPILDLKKALDSLLIGRVCVPCHVTWGSVEVLARQNLATLQIVGIVRLMSDKQTLRSSLN